jgi:hypothetical protein
MDFDTAIPLASSLFCGIAGTVTYRRIPPAFRLLVVHAFLSFAMDAWGYLSIARFGFQNNQVFFNFYLPVDFLLMLFATRANFGKHFRSFAIVSITIFAVLWGASLRTDGVHVFANHVLIVYAVMLTVDYFIVLLRNVQEEPSRKTTAIYCIAVPVILYYCCTIPHFGLMRYFEQSTFSNAGYYINGALNALRYSLTGVGLILLSKTIAKPALHAYQ